MNTSTGPGTNMRLASRTICGIIGKDFKEEMMSLLQSYADCVRAGDADKMASLFTENAHFRDEAPTQMGMDPIDVTGKGDLLSMFKQIFANGGLNVINVAVNDCAMRYDIDLGGIAVLCLGVMKTEDGLIKEYKVVAA